MDIVGGGQVIEYGPEEEVRHRPGDHELWQESFVLLWWDMAQQIGGFHRIGHEPHGRDGPKVALINSVFTPEYIYKDVSTLPLRAQDEFPTGASGGDTCRFEFTDHAIWTLDAPEVKATLHVTDSHTPVDIYPKASDLSKDVSPNHMEVGGSVSGTLVVKGRHYTVDGLAFRDHGWGKRDWSGIVCHRWLAMSFPGQVMALIQTFLSPSNELVKFGCVIRNHQLVYAKEVDVLTYLEPDGLTHRGGWASLTLTTGEVMDFVFEPFQKGVASWIHGIACVDTMCRVTCGDLVGICDFEITNNALRGSHRPSLALNAIERNGLTRVG